MKRDFLVIGNYSHDLLIHSGKKYQRLGGPPAYISRVLSALGADYKVVSKVGRDFKYFENVYQKPILVGSPTACMEHVFENGKRLYSRMLECGEKIYPEDIKIGAKIAIIGAHVNEVPAETIRFVRGFSDIVLADIQGFIRKTDNQKKVYLVDLKETPYWDVLECIDFLKINQEESRHVDIGEVREKTKIIMTLGDKGNKIISKEGEIYMHSKPLGAKDPTGAGDFFMAGFAWGLLKGFDLKRCAEIANYCGGLAVKNIGVGKIPSRLLKRFLS